MANYEIPPKYTVWAPISELFSPQKNSIILIQKNSKKINRITTLEKSKKLSTETIKSGFKTKEKEKTTIKTEPTAQKIDKKEVKKK